MHSIEANCIPHELWRYIFSFLPSASLYNCLFVQKKWFLICSTVKIRILIHLSLDSYPLPLQILPLTKANHEWKASKFDMNLEVKLSTLEMISFETLDTVLQDYVKQIMKGRSFKLLYMHFLDKQRSESSYKENTINEDIYKQIYKLMNAFKVVTIRHPAPFIATLLPSTMDFINFERVHNSMHGFECLREAKYLRMESDGRFLNQEGQFDFKSFEMLSTLNIHLKHLILEGPWLQSMINYSVGAIEAFKSIKCLETLVVDLDMIKCGPDLLYSVLNSLPKLKRFGRLGRVDKRFWRLFPKYSCKKLTTVELGSLKSPNSFLQDANPAFLKDLAFGILWSFPNVRILRIFLGNQNIDQEPLLDMLKTLKEGIPLVYREYEESDYPDPSGRKLEIVELLQMSDIDLIQDSRWKYVALKHGGGRPISLFATDGTSTEITAKTSWKKF